MADLYRARCQWCGRVGGTAYGTPTGGAPNQTPYIPDTCKSHPSGKPNMSHTPKWEKA